MFVKPRIGLGGDGSERFRWQGRDFESNRGGRLRPEDLGDYLETRARTENRTLLVQPALSNRSRSLASMRDGALAYGKVGFWNVTRWRRDSSVCLYLFWGARPNSGTRARYRGTGHIVSESRLASGTARFPSEKAADPSNEHQPASCLRVAGLGNPATTRQSRASGMQQFCVYWVGRGLHRAGANAS